MSYEFYKVLHLLGVFLTLTGLIGIATLKWAGTGLPAAPRRAFFLMHGIGLLIAFVAGFGLAARLGMFANLQGWVWAKIGLWLAMGGLIAVAKRKGEMGVTLILSFIALAGVAAWLAIFKPF